MERTTFNPRHQSYSPISRTTKSSYARAPVIRVWRVLSSQREYDVIFIDATSFAFTCSILCSHCNMLQLSGLRQIDSHNQSTLGAPHGASLAATIGKGAYLLISRKSMIPPL